MTIELTVEVKGGSPITQTDKPEITISLDVIEGTPEKLAEYDLNFPQ